MSSTQFKVSFFNQLGQPLPFSDSLSKQVLTVHGISQRTKGEQEGTLLTFNDDVAKNIAMHGVQSLRSMDGFKIAIETVLNDEVLRTIVLSGCTVDGVFHSAFSVTDNITLPKIEVSIRYVEANLFYPKGL
jgi:hypothetical protein